MNSSLLLLTLGASLIGLAAPLARMAEAPPNWIGIYRCGMAAVILLGMLFVKHRGQVKSLLQALSTPGLAHLLLTGFIFGVDMFFWHKAIQNAGAGISTVLGNTQVFYLALIGWLVNRERLTFLYWMSLLLTIVGIILMVGDLKMEGFPNYSNGIIYGLLVGICYASYTFAMSKTRLKTNGLGVLERLFWIMSMSALTLLCFEYLETLYFNSFGASSWDWSLLVTLNIPDLKMESYLWLLMLALVPQIVGWYWITKAVTEVSLSISGLVLVLQPVVSVLIGVLLLNESVEGLRILGVALTLIAIFLGTYKPRNKNLEVRN
jgi:drug/metabolite transporter (DMT)-like permease